MEEKMKSKKTHVWYVLVLLVVSVLFLAACSETGNHCEREALQGRLFALLLVIEAFENLLSRLLALSCSLLEQSKYRLRSPLTE